MIFLKSENFFDKVTGMSSVTYKSSPALLKVTLFHFNGSICKLSFFRVENINDIEVCIFDNKGNADCKIYRASGGGAGSKHRVLDAKLMRDYFSGIIVNSESGLDEPIKRDILSILKA